MAERIATMEEFAKRYGIAIGDPDLKRQYDRWWQSEMEYNTMMYEIEREAREAREEALKEGHAEGLAEGLAEGRAEGLVEGREELAAKLRGLGVDDTVLAQALAGL